MAKINASTRLTLKPPFPEIPNWYPSAIMDKNEPTYKTRSTAKGIREAINNVIRLLKPSTRFVMDVE